MKTSCRLWQPGRKLKTKKMDFPAKKGTGRAATYRRYPSGKHPIYDREYNVFRVKSSILNEGGRSIWDIGRFSSIQSLEKELYLLLGQKDNFGKIVTNKGQETFAAIPKIQKRLKALKKKLDERKENLLLGGYSLDEIKEPKNMKEERLINEAHLDVKMAEVEYLTKAIEKLKQEQANVELGKILEYGPCFTRKGVPPRLVDGQKVGACIDAKGNRFLIIDDERSPYNGMSLTDYKALCKDWLAERSARLSKLRAEREQEILEKGYSNIHIPLATSKPKKQNLPKWPKDVVNYKE